MKFRSLMLSMVLCACGGDESTKPAAVVDVPVVRRPVIDDVVPAPTKVDVPPAVVEATPALPATFAECMTLGRALVGKGDHAKAREAFAAAATLDRKSAEPHVELARSYIATGDRALAMKAANRGVKLAPSSSHAYNTLGRAELLRHGYDNAIAAFAHATELDADNAWAWNNLGYTHLLRKDYEAAVAALVEATAKKSATGYMWNNLGLAYEQLDQLEDARVAFEQGGKLGSKEAAHSRRRLEGVETIIAVKAAPVEDEAQPETSYPTSEEPLEEVEDTEDAETTDDEPDELPVDAEVDATM